LDSYKSTANNERLAIASLFPRPTGSISHTRGDCATFFTRAIPATARERISLDEEAETAGKSRDDQEINLPPGKYLFTFKTASGPVQKREFMLVADETWGLLIGPGGVPLPVHLY